MKTVLVISGGGFQGLTLVHALQHLDRVRVIVCDIHAENITRYVCSDYLVAPPLSEKAAFASFLLKLVEREHVDAIFPATAYELIALSRLEPQLAACGAVVAVSEEALLVTLLDKLRTHEWLSAAMLPVPFLHDPLVFDFHRPLFGRPRRGWGGRGTIVLYSRDEAVDHHGDLDAYVWTEWLEQFEEFSVDFAIDIRGRLSPIVLRRRVRATGGFAVISESVTDTSLEDLAGRAAKSIAHMGGRGLFNVQILQPIDTPLFISDVNPRIGTSATHAIAEGVNLPGFFIKSSDSTLLSAPTLNRKMGKSVRILKEVVIPRLAQIPGGVVFDLDDTLVDHKLWMLRKMEVIYTETFSDQVDMDTFLLCAARLIDEGERAQLIDRLLADLSLSADLRDDAIEAYRAAIVFDTPIFPDVASTFARLKAAGVSIAILTDNPKATQEAKVRHAPVLRFVDAVVYTREHGAEKPDRAGFLKAASVLSMDPNQLVMIGDNYFRDGVGAVQAGYMHAFIVRREGTFLSVHAGLASRLATKSSQRIDVVDSLLSACHACIES